MTILVTRTESNKRNLLARCLFDANYTCMFSWWRWRRHTRTDLTRWSPSRCISCARAMTASIWARSSLLRWLRSGWSRGVASEWQLELEPRRPNATEPPGSDIGLERPDAGCDGGRAASGGGGFVGVESSPTIELKKDLNMPPCAHKPLGECGGYFWWRHRCVSTPQNSATHQAQKSVTPPQSPSSNSIAVTHSSSSNAGSFPAHWALNWIPPFPYRAGAITGLLECRTSNRSRRHLS